MGTDARLPYDYGGIELALLEEPLMGRSIETGADDPGAYP
jgi:hypothetical protein